MIAALILISGCSIQVAGLSGAYSESLSKVSSDSAILNIATDNVRVISIDGKSINKKSTIFFNPGHHEITLYVGANNYVSKVNHMMILAVTFIPQHSYFLKSSVNNIWIEDAQATSVSSVVSDMLIKKRGQI